MTTVDQREFRWILEYEIREESPDYPKVDIPMDDLALARFDPWACSEPDARSAMRRWLINGNDREAANNPWFQYKVAGEIISCRDVIENTKLRNHGLNLMNCTNKLLRHQLVAPQWLADAFNNVCEPVLGRKSVSWDDPLGKPVGPGVDQKRLDRIRKHREKLPLIKEVGKFVEQEIALTGNKSKSYELAQEAFEYLPEGHAKRYYQLYLRLTNANHKHGGKSNQD